MAAPFVGRPFRRKQEVIHTKIDTKRICGPPYSRRGRPTHIRVMAATLTAFFAASVFAYAGGIEATVNSFVTKLLNMFSGILLDICDLLVGPIFSITMMNTAEIARYIPGFDVAAPAGDFLTKSIQALGICIASCLALLGVLKIVIGMMRDQKIGSIGSLLWRMALFIPLTIFGQKMLQRLFDGIISPIASGFAGGVMSDTLIASKLNKPGASFKEIAESASGTFSSSLGIVGVVVVTILMVMIGYNLIGLVLEAAERYLICVVIIFISPLAFAAGVGEETENVAKNWLKMFWSHCVLLILNIWVIGIGRSCFVTEHFTNSGDFLTWAIVTYAYFKIAQKLDDMMQNSGLMVTRTGTDFVHDAMLATGAIAATGKHLFGGAADTVVAGAGVAKAIRDGGGVGAVARPIASYVKSHPILAPTAGAAAAATGATVGFANLATASHALAHTTDAARASAMASGVQNGKPLNFNTPAFRAAAQNQMLQAGFAAAQGAKVDSLTGNQDGTLSGVLTKRDATGRVQEQTAFTLSNASGTKDGAAVQAGRTMTVGADGKSATISDPQAGTFALTQTGTDKYGNQVWQATRMANGNGAALAAQAVGDTATTEFSFRPDARSTDGVGAQAANAFMTGGTMDALTQQSDAAVARYDQMEADKTSALHDLHTMGDAQRVAQMRDENSTVDYSSAGYRAATAEYMKENGLDGGMIDRGGEIVAQQVAEDGRLVGCMAVRDADGNVLEEKFYALSTQAPEPDAAPPATDMPETAGHGPDVQSAGDGAPAQAVSVRSASETMDIGTAGTTEGAIVSGERAEYPATDLSQQASAADTVMNADAGYSEPAQTVTGGQMGAETAKATTATLDEVLTAKYQMIDEGHGTVETSDLGKLQVSRVSVDETTGDTKWQIIRKGADKEFEGPEAEESVVTFERRGNRGNAQTFKDILRDIRNTRTFDQLGMIDSKVRERPDDSHLFR